MTGAHHHAASNEYQEVFNARIALSAREASRLRVAAVLAGLTVTDAFASGAEAESTSAAADGPNVTPSSALKLLIDGNRRWIKGHPAHPHHSVARRRALRDEQRPIATIVSCIDSRVPPEIVFDCGIGDLAVIRTGAQVLDEGVVRGSVEFTPSHLATPLILVMGHQRCGAVKAAIELIQAGTTAPGHIQAIVDALRPAYAVAVGQRGNLIDNMVRAQTKLAVEQIRNDARIKKFISRGELAVVGGYYSLDTGTVSIIAR